jgi:hypothetical protein
VLIADSVHDDARRLARDLLLDRGQEILRLARRLRNSTISNGILSAYLRDRPPSVSITMMSPPRTR